VLKCASMLRSSHPLGIAHRMTVVMPLFADWRQKSVTIAMSL